MIISSYARSWILLAPLVPSIMITIFVLYHLLKNRVLRSALNNHVIIVLLFVVLVEELTGTVWNIYFFRNNISPLLTSTFCYAWVYLDTVATVSIYILITWAAIERHILIFHSNMLMTRKKRLIFHYLPIVACILYPMTFYFVLFFLVPCNLPLSYTLRQCGRYSCIISSPNIGLYDGLVHYILLAFVTVIFSVGLFLRVLHQKYQVHRRFIWRNYRKMVWQLFPIALLYMLLQLPPMLLYAAYSAGLSRTVGADFFSNSLFFSFYIVLLTPFACAASLPGLRTKCRDALLFWRRGHTIGPVQVVAATPANVQRANGNATTPV
ncbi:unnamed protein product [Adineta ricciae]|uniref:G-protein coupled receptors family 1 profile domain-containing protein n=1 Tax=Adineta ricciae TaxID=249248 RepID=A0A814XJG6_ADIRI|nr:unnamed protein product [Adineta ricciae]